jgi:hypothetical protein
VTGGRVSDPTTIFVNLGAERTLASRNQSRCLSPGRKRPERQPGTYQR